MTARLFMIPLLLVAVVAGANWAMDFDEEWALATWTPAKLNPIAWYKLNGDGKDSSGNGYDCIWSGTEAYADGVIGQAASLNGASYLSRASGFCPASNFTLTAWVKPRGYGGFRAIAGAGYLASVTGYGLYLDSSRATIQSRVVYEINSADSSTGGGDTWLHLVGRRSGTTVDLYINGVLVDSVPATVWSSPSQQWGVGAREDRAAWGFYFTGLIQDVLLFDRALTAEEVTKLYTESVLKSAKGGTW